MNEKAIGFFLWKFRNASRESKGASNDRETDGRSFKRFRHIYITCFWPTTTSALTFFITCRISDLRTANVSLVAGELLVAIILSLVFGSVASIVASAFLERYDDINPRATLRWRSIAVACAVGIVTGLGFLIDAVPNPGLSSR